MTEVETQESELAWPHMAAAGAAAVWNVKHVFTLCCEEWSQDALLSLEGRSGHVCLPHGANLRDVYALFRVLGLCLAGVGDAPAVTMAYSTALNLFKPLFIQY